MVGDAKIPTKNYIILYIYYIYILYIYYIYIYIYQQYWRILEIFTHKGWMVNVLEQVGWFVSLGLPHSGSFADACHGMRHF